ncbi:MAG: hypothetical protein AB7O37_06665 [Vicinamibacteria bacterium]
MLELRESLDSLIARHSRVTAATRFPRARAIRLHDAHLEPLGLAEEDLAADALVLGRDATERGGRAA